MNWYKRSFNLNNLKNVFKGMGATIGISIPFMLAILNMSNKDYMSLWDKHQGNEQAIRQELEKKIEEKSKFDYAAFTNKIRQYEGYRNKVYDDGRGNATIGVGHMITPQSRQTFNQLFGKTVNFDDVASGKTTLTKSQIQRLTN